MDILKLNLVKRLLHLKIRKAPSLSLLAPDIYDTGFKGWATQYALPDNPLFIPESRSYSTHPAGVACNAK